MQATKTFTSFLAGGAVLLAISGCRPAPSNNAAPSSQATALSPGAPKAPAAPVKMTPSQNLGVTILKAFNAAPNMKGHSISVGTTKDTVMLNGKVKSAAQKKVAETIARRHAKGYKVVNDLKVSAK